MTGSNFVEVTATTLNGTAVTTAPYVDTYGPKEAMVTQQGNGGKCVDRVTYDLSLTQIPSAGTPPPVPENYGTIVGAFAKNACALLTLTGTTAITLDLTNVVAATGVVVAGDTSFATANVLILNNLGAVDLTISPGGSNPARIPQLGGTTPTLTIPAGSCIAIHSAAGYAVDSTHKTFTITPTAGGTLAVSVGGA
jgi:hypothetical protein